MHRLARGGEPEQPPAEEPFARAARERARVRPAGLGRRFTARLVDSALLGALVAAVAVPVGLRTLQHVDHKIEAARHSGRTVTVWLVDGTTGAHLAVVLGALLIFGFVYEVLPTAWWGRTVGKQLCGVTVLDMGSQRLPSFGASLRRWLTHTLLGLIAIGALGVLWALFDHPWRQCWHDKAARTFVAVRRPSPRGA
ncbi:RDD family protein [Streptomyces clavuligerus]|uniref:RDD family protein n=1 Tax=Streptomyces clavuligerus TaxID=1901 RepID=UPI00031FB9B7|nr:RDD family protein [Streptomyces clavuligerus]